MEFDSLSLFDIYVEAIVAVQDGKAVYANRRASEVFGYDPVGEQAENLFPKELLSFPSAHFSGTVMMKNASVTVNSQARGDLRIFSMLPSHDASHQEKLSNAMRRELANCLGNIQMSSALLNPHIDHENEQLSAWSSMLTHNCYRLNRLSAHLAILTDGWHLPTAKNSSYFEVGETVEAVVHSSKIFGLSDKRELTCTVPEKKLYLSGSCIPLEILLMNLLSNSVKYTPDGGKIEVIVSDGESRISLKVRDNGSGIAPDKLLNIFQSYLEPVELTDPKRGVGMGLAVCKRICEAFGGTVFLESTVGKGTSVTVFLPKTDLSHRVFSENAYQRPGQASILAELSDVLHHSFYTPKYLD